MHDLVAQVVPPDFNIQLLGHFVFYLHCAGFMKQRHLTVSFGTFHESGECEPGPRVNTHYRESVSLGNPNVLAVV